MKYKTGKKKKCPGPVKQSNVFTDKNYYFIDYQYNIINLHAYIFIN